MMQHIWLIVALAVVLVRSDGLNPISAPRAGSVVEAEKPYTIRWRSGTPGPVKIELHYAETAYVNITGKHNRIAFLRGLNLQLTVATESTENDGTFEWMPSGVFDGKDNFFLAICDLIVPRECTYTFNGRFAISSGTQSSSSSSIRSFSTSFNGQRYVSRHGPSITLLTLQLSSTTTTYASTSFPTASASRTEPTTSSAPAPASDGGLSSKGTIAVAVVLAVLGTALVGLGLFFWHRKRQRRNNIRGHADGRSTVIYKQHGVHEGAQAELDGRQIPSELGPQEMTQHTGTVHHELPERAK
jgi:hypothetical protein